MLCNAMMIRNSNNKLAKGWWYDNYIKLLLILLGWCWVLWHGSQSLVSFNVIQFGWLLIRQNLSWILYKQKIFWMKRHRNIDHFCVKITKMMRIQKKRKKTRKAKIYLSRIKKIHYLSSEKIPIYSQDSLTLMLKLYYPREQTISTTTITVPK